jgi:hypothetical protein
MFGILQNNSNKTKEERNKAENVFYQITVYIIYICLAVWIKEYLRYMSVYIRQVSSIEIIWKLVQKSVNTSQKLL